MNITCGVRIQTRAGALSSSPNWASANKRGEAALKAVDCAVHRNQLFRIVLVDARMPEMDGFKLAERLRNDPRMRGTLIMMLTSSGQRGDAARCRQLLRGSP